MPSPSASPDGSSRDRWVTAVVEAEAKALTELLASRPEILMTGPNDLDDVVDALLDPKLLRSFYDTADRSTRQVLEGLCVLPTPSDLEDLARALTTDASALLPVVDRLRTSGLVLPVVGGARASTLVRNPGLREAIPYPAGLGGAAAEMLSAYSVRELSEIGARLGVVAKGAKRSVVEVVTEALSSPEGMAAAVRGGPPGTEELARRLAGDHIQVTMTWGMYETSRTDRTPQGWLLRRGMIVPSAWGSATMPAEVALALRGGRLFASFLPDGPPAPTTAVDIGRVDRAAADAALQIVADVTAVLEAWAAEPAKQLRSGGLGVREVRRVAKLINRSEATSACLIDLIAYADLAAIEDDVALPTAAYDRWIDAGISARWGELAEAWCGAPVHFSLAGAIDHKGKPIPAMLAGPPEFEAAARRHAMLEMLAGVPPEAAVERSVAVARVTWAMPALWENGPSRPERMASWILEEAEMLGVIADGAPSTFGRALIDGDDVMTQALAALAPPLTSEIVLQADLTAVASGELAPDFKRELDLLADVESTGAATVYRFGEISLRRGFDAGRTAEQILDWLRQHAPKGIPQPLAYLVDDLARRFGRARVGVAASYVRSDDAALLIEMVRARKAARLGLRLVAPTVAVSEAPRDLTVRVLREAGYLAAPEEADGVLTLTRPPSRRAKTEDPTPDGEGPELKDVLANPELLASFVGLPATAMPPGFLEGLKRLIDGQDQAGEAVVLDEPFDLDALVGRLRRAPRRSRHAKRPEPPPGRVPTPDLFPQLQLLRDQVEGRPLDDQPARPTHIARDRSSILDLVSQATEEDWLIRLSFLDARGQEVDTYAEVFHLSTSAIKISSYLDGTVRSINLKMIKWVRVATEAEESVLDD